MHERFSFKYIFRAVWGDFGRRQNVGKLSAEEKKIRDIALAIPRPFREKYGQSQATFRLVQLKTQVRMFFKRNSLFCQFTFLEEKKTRTKIKINKTCFFIRHRSILSTYMCTCIVMPAAGGRFKQVCPFAYFCTLYPIITDFNCLWQKIQICRV